MQAKVYRYHYFAKLEKKEFFTLSSMDHLVMILHISIGIVNRKEARVNS